MNNEIMEYGQYAPYIGAAYGVSVLAVAAMIIVRWRKLKKALDDERNNKKNP